MTKILDEDRQYYAFLTLNMLRKKVSKDVSEINVTDLGAGSKRLKTSRRKVRDIAKLSVKKSKYAEILFRLVESGDIQLSVELGTSLGVTTGYLAMANSKGKVITLEGCSEISKVAKENFKELGLRNVTNVLGDFDDTFIPVLKGNPNAGLIFIDGNHTKEATLRYFQNCVEFANKDVILVFDDIHWSKGMEEAWHEIISSPNTQASVDLYEMGIVFMSKEYVHPSYSIVI